MVQFLEQLHRLQMRLLHHLGELRKPRVRHVDPQQQFLPFRRGPARRDVAHAVVDTVNVPRPRHGVAHREFVDALRMPYGLEERTPVAA